MILIVIVAAPIFLITFVENNQSSEPEFYVGVEYAIDNYSVEGCKALVDKVKSFTNVFIVDTVGITYDINNLNEVCDYVYDSGLYFYVFFISLVYLQDDGDFVLRYNYYPHMWIAEAKQKYGDKFLGTYAMDEPGGNQLDDGSFQMVKSADNQSEAAQNFVDLLNRHTSYYGYARDCENIKLLTSEYGLYWFDYKAGYDVVLVEYAWNHSRPLHTALCRGAANLQNKEWGVMVTWTYNDVPYIVSGDELYTDLVLAYHAGAKYVTVFDHPDTNYSDYGILTEEHFEALQKFRNYVKENPSKHASTKATAVYVLPENFGFGFRTANDHIWGIWKGDTDPRTEKIWNDVNMLVEKYGFNLDIVFSDQKYNNELSWHYDEIYFWHQQIN